MEKTAQNGRIQWLDAMKALCILTVFFVHGTLGGHYAALFNYVNGAFFFCSGCMASRHLDRKFADYAKSRFVAILWPYTTFAVLTLAVRACLTDVDVADYIARFFYGSRSYCCSLTFWFLPCLFVMSLYYYIVRHIVKNDGAALAVCFAVSCAVKILHEAPTLPWGVDTAARFLIYYALGDVCTRRAGQLKKPVLYAGLGAGCVWAALTFIFAGGLPAMLLGHPLPLYGEYLHQFITTLALIAVYFVLAYLLRNAAPLRKLGRYTVVLCCTEEITKTVFPFLWQHLGVPAFEPMGTFAVLYGIGMALLCCLVILQPIAKFAPWMIRCPFVDKKAA